MELAEYLKFTDTTAIYPRAGTGEPIELNYLTLGLVSEAGEVAGKVKKKIRDGAWEVEAVADEIADVFWYLVRLCAAIGYTPEDILQMNADKLASRKARGTLSGSGDAR